VTIDDDTHKKLEAMIAEYRKQGLDLKTPTIVRMALTKLFEGEGE
jgi:hypothetical protein